MASKVSRTFLNRIFFPGIVPAMEKQLLRIPMPSIVRTVIGAVSNSLDHATHIAAAVTSLHPAGLLTIHFWAPSMKWFISIANILDFNRPVEKVSAAQQSGNVSPNTMLFISFHRLYAAVALTGLIWSRYSFVIVPVNYNLFSVNIAMAVTGLYQLFRTTRHYYLNKDKK